MKSSELLSILEKNILQRVDSDGMAFPSEMDIVRSYGISRNAVREAIGSLVERGLLERRHGVGLVVVNRTAEATDRALSLALRSQGFPLWDVLAMRELLEEYSAAEAATHRTDQDLVELEEQIGKMLDEESPRSAYIEADFQFHLLLARASGNAVLPVILSSLSRSLLEMIEQTVEDWHRPEVVDGFHRSILAAVKLRDADAAAGEMRAHLQATAELLQFHHTSAEHVPTAAIT